MSQPVFTIGENDVRIVVSSEVLWWLTNDITLTLDQPDIRWGYHPPTYVAKQLTDDIKVWPNGQLDFSSVVNRLKSLYCHKLGADANQSLKAIGRALKQLRNKYEPIN